MKSYCSSLAYAGRRAGRPSAPWSKPVKNVSSVYSAALKQLMAAPRRCSVYEKYKIGSQTILFVCLAPLSSANTVTHQERQFGLANVGRSNARSEV